MKKFMLGVASTIAAFGVLVPSSYAGPIINQTLTGPLPATISGTLPNQNTALEEAFTLSAAGSLTITSTSYATGGFEPNLFLYNSAGNFVAAGTPFGAADPGTGIIGDMRLTEANLPAGVYTLAITDFLLNQSLTATNLSAGFTVNFGSGTTFTDADGNTRTGNFAVAIASASASAVPEPATIWLAAPFIGVFILWARKQRLA